MTNVRFPAQYFEVETVASVRCLLCPHHCRIAPGKTGLCGARLNENGTLFTRNYSVVSGMSMDPIEKKPLYHFHPGKRIFSIGTVGCNLDCPFCQNFQISRYFDTRSLMQLDKIMPGEMVDIAVRNGSFGIAYTYSEPAVWYEYVYDVSKLAHKKGLANVWVTNGFIESSPLKAILPYIDAANVDLKAYDDQAYRELRGAFEPVLATIETLYAAGVHLELTTLVVPGLNDDPARLVELAKRIAAIDRKIPYHLSRYFPRYRYRNEATDVELLERIRAAVSEHLDYVYVGNTGSESDTLCPNCGNVLIQRSGYSTVLSGIGTGDSGLVCKNCGVKADIVTGEEP